MGQDLVEVIKANAMGILCWLFLGMNFAFDETLNIPTFMPHIVMITAVINVLIIGLCPLLRDLNTLGDKRSLRFAVPVCVTYGWQWIILTQAMIRRYQKVMGFYDRKIFGLYCTNPNYSRRVLLATKPFAVRNVCQFIEARKVAEEHGIVSLFIWEQNELHETSEVVLERSQIGRNFSDNNQVLSFEVKETYKTYKYTVGPCLPKGRTIFAS